MYFIKRSVNSQTVNPASSCTCGETAFFWGGRESELTNDCRMWWDFIVRILLLWLHKCLFYFTIYLVFVYVCMFVQCMSMYTCTKWLTICRSQRIAFESCCPFSPYGFRLLAPIVLEILKSIVFFIAIIYREGNITGSVK